MRTMITNGCVQCHMAAADGWNSGGHTMNVSFDGELNTAGCIDCHDDAKAMLQNSIDALD